MNFWVNYFKKYFSFVKQWRFPARPMSIFTNASVPWEPLPTPWRRGPSEDPWNNPSWTRIPGRVWNCLNIARMAPRPCITTCKHSLLTTLYHGIWLLNFNRIILFSCSQLCMNIKNICNSSSQRQFDAFPNIYVCRSCINKYVLKEVYFNIGILHIFPTKYRDRSIKLCHPRSQL